MRKRIIASAQQETATPNLEWLDMEALAEVEITSEDADHLIELALLPGPVPQGGAPQGRESRKSVFSLPIRNSFGGSG